WLYDDYELSQIDTSDALQPFIYGHEQVLRARIRLLQTAIAMTPQPKTREIYHTLNAPQSDWSRYPDLYQHFVNVLSDALKQGWEAHKVWQVNATTTLDGIAQFTRLLGIGGGERFCAYYREVWDTYPLPLDLLIIP